MKKNSKEPKINTAELNCGSMISIETLNDDKHLMTIETDKTTTILTLSKKDLRLISDTIELRLTLNSRLF